jgi:hypothetical protein
MLSHIDRYTGHFNEECDFLFRKVLMKYILRTIYHSDDNEIDAIIKAIINRYRTKHPDWEIIFLSIPKNDLTARKNQLHALMAFLEKHDPSF